MQALAWIAEASPTLERLTTLASGFEETIEDRSGAQNLVRLAVSSLLGLVQDPLTRLRRLDLTDGNSLLPSSQWLDRDRLPILEHVELTIHQPTILRLINVSTSLRRARLTLVPPFSLSGTSLEIGILKKFVQYHDNLELLCITVDDRRAVHPGWADDLSKLCAEKGIAFASDEIGWPRSLALFGAEEHLGYEYQRKTGSDGVERAVWVDKEGEWWSCRVCTWDTDSETVSDGENEDRMDFDEDDEMWSHLWSEKKRWAIGLDESSLSSLSVAVSR